MGGGDVGGMLCLGEGSRRQSLAAPAAKGCVHTQVQQRRVHTQGQQRRMHTEGQQGQLGPQGQQGQAAAITNNGQQGQAAAITNNGQQGQQGPSHLQVGVVKGHTVHH